MELLSCPFCGNEAEKIITSIQCKKCEAVMEDEKSWNTRPSPWISVKDRLPETNGNYLVKINKYHPYNIKKITDIFYEVDLFVDNLWNKEMPGSSLYGENKITHWMPLPQPPKETE